MSNTIQAPVTDGIRKETSKTEISLDKMYVSEFQKKGTKTVQLRQEVTTKAFYPSVKAHNAFSGGLFNSDEFGFEGQDFISVEKRVCWENVPENATEEEIKNRLGVWNHKGATIYKVLSNRPILTPDDVRGIEVELTTMDIIANTQVVRYPEDHEKAGQLILDANGKVQYKRTGLSPVPVEDTDNRTADATDYYVSQEIIAEMQGSALIANQQI